MQGTRQIVVGMAFMAGLFLGACDRSDTSAGKRELVVFVAASLADAVGQISRDFERKQGITVRINAAASGLLRAQIERGAACDVFISADHDEMDRLERGGRIDSHSRRVVVGNTLVVAAMADSGMTIDRLNDLSGFTDSRIAMGDPAYVPAGRYARQFLEASGDWKVVSKQTVLADNVRIALGYLRSGQVDFAVVYETDVANEPALKTLYRFDDSKQAVTCPAAICTDVADRDLAERFLERLTAESASKTWGSMGFRTAMSAMQAGR